MSDVHCICCLFWFGLFHVTDPDPPVLISLTVFQLEPVSQSVNPDSSLRQRLAVREFVTPVTQSVSHVTVCLHSHSPSLSFALLLSLLCPLLLLPLFYLPLCTSLSPAHCLSLSFTVLPFCTSNLLSFPLSLSLIYHIAMHITPAFILYIYVFDFSPSAEALSLLSLHAIILREVSPTKYSPVWYASISSGEPHFLYFLVHFYCTILSPFLKFHFIFSSPLVSPLVSSSHVPLVGESSADCLSCDPSKLLFHKTCSAIPQCFKHQYYNKTFSVSILTSC